MIRQLALQPGTHSTEPHATVTARTPQREAAPAQPNRRRHIVAAARIIASLLLLGLVLSWVDWPGALAVLTGAHTGLLLLLLLVLLAERFLSAYRWHVLIRAHAPDIRYLAVLKMTYLSLFLGHFLPGGVGMEAVRIAGLARSTSDLAGAFSSVLVDRLLGLAALLLIMFLVLPAAPAEIAAPMATLGLALIAAAAIAGAIALRIAKSPSALRRLPAWLTRPIAPKARKLGHSLRQLARRPRALLWAASLAFAFQLVRILITPLAALALGLDIPLIYFFIYVPIIVLMAMLPFSFGGLGVREAGFVYFFGASLTTPEAAFALSLVIYFMGILTSLPGAAVLALHAHTRHGNTTP